MLKVTSRQVANWDRFSAASFAVGLGGLKVSSQPLKHKTPSRGSCDYSAERVDFVRRVWIAVQPAALRDGLKTPSPTCCQFTTQTGSVRNGDHHGGVTAWGEGLRKAEGRLLIFRGFPALATNSEAGSDTPSLKPSRVRSHVVSTYSGPNWQAGAWKGAEPDHRNRVTLNEALAVDAAPDKRKRLQPAGNAIGQLPILGRFKRVACLLSKV